MFSCHSRKRTTNSLFMKNNQSVLWNRDTCVYRSIRWPSTTIDKFSYTRIISAGYERVTGSSRQGYVVNAIYRMLRATEENLVRCQVRLSILFNSPLFDSESPSSIEFSGLVLCVSIYFCSTKVL